MQQGAKLIQGDAELFNGVFQIVVKDVVSDAKEVAQEFLQKIQHIIARDKEDNFFLRLYKGRVLTSVDSLKIFTSEISMCQLPGLKPCLQN